MKKEDQKVYDEICEVDSKVFALEKQADQLLRSVQEKRKTLRSKGIMV